MRGGHGRMVVGQVCHPDQDRGSGARHFLQKPQLRGMTARHDDLYDKALGSGRPAGCTAVTWIATPNALTVGSPGRPWPLRSLVPPALLPVDVPESPVPPAGLLAGTAQNRGLWTGARPVRSHRRAIGRAIGASGFPDAWGRFRSIGRSSAPGPIAPPGGGESGEASVR
jgi:hypothetical protein